MMFTSSRPEVLLNQEITRLHELRDVLGRLDARGRSRALRRIECHLDVAIASLERDCDALAWSLPLALAPDDRLALVS